MNSQNSNENKNERQSQATKILEMLAGRILFHDQLDRTFMEINMGTHSENLLLDDPRTSQLIASEYYGLHGSAAASSAIKDALITLTGKARFASECRETSLRTAYHEGSYFLDFCSVDWMVAKITPQGWTLEPMNTPAFYRSSISRPLEQPIRGGSLEQLWQFVNVPDCARILVLTFLLECLRPNTDYPILVLDGEQGSAKSTTQKYLKMLIDPSALALRVAPKKLDDVFVAANNDHILSFNNLSGLTNQLQDVLCSFSTGGAYSRRTLYTDLGESVINVRCPVMLNGIGGLVTRQDLLERCIYLELPPIEVGARRTGAELGALFQDAMPSLLGALLDLLVKAQQLLPTIPRDKLPRMADYCLLGRAVAAAMGYNPGHFDEAYEQNQRAGLERGLESCAIYPALTALLDVQHYGFSGTYQQLLKALNAYRDGESSGWPQSPKALSTTLKRQAPALRRVGIDVQCDDKRRTEGFHVSIQRRDD